MLWNSEFIQLMAIDFPLFLTTFGYLPNHMALLLETNSMKYLFIRVCGARMLYWKITLTLNNSSIFGNKCYVPTVILVCVTEANI